MFLNLNSSKRNDYVDLLTKVGSLSKLFNDSDVPYLYYRVHENIFCKTLGAENLSRSDVSYDAIINGVGIGLKTFLHGNGNTLQKVAEFNAFSDSLRTLKNQDLINEVSRLRNIRVETTKTQYGTQEAIYHCLTRKKNEFCIFECPLTTINVNKIKKVTHNKNAVSFSDDKHDYSYNISKSTLFKRFTFLDKPLMSFPVKIVDDPYELVLLATRSISTLAEANPLIEGRDFIYLPLYSPRSKEFEPEPRSGLNQWNAGGRARDPNEIYIPIPKWIHDKCNNFFPNDNETLFSLLLPDHTPLKAKLCQSDSKALMSNPNKSLGDWILRKLLKLKEGVLVTRKILEQANIDSVIIYKITESEYKIDFATLGKFEEFKLRMNPDLQESPLVHNNP